MSEEHFRKVYDADEKNKVLQTWDDYWKAAKAAKDQWDRFLVDAPAKLKLKPAIRASAIRQLQPMGYRAIGEAVKHTKVRAISPAELASYQDAIISSASGDTGNGEAVLPTIDNIEGLVNKPIQDRGLPLI